MINFSSFKKGGIMEKRASLIPAPYCHPRENGDPEILTRFPPPRE